VTPLIPHLKLLVCDMRPTIKPLAEGLADFDEMMWSKQGLKLLLAKMPEGSTLADAERLRERVKQMGRQPCSFLDEELGIERD
jgi:hypothetical protein